MPGKKFKTVVELGERGRVFINIPFNPAEEWGKQVRHYVQGTINEAPFKSSLGMKNGGYFMPLTKDLQDEADIAPGDEVYVEMESSDAHEHEPPEDLASELNKDPEAKSFFEQLTPFYRNTYIKWVESAKKGDTRDARVAEVIELLKAGKKQR